ncbi:MAG TPA: phosphopantetheine-binding protein [Actinocrinis sp.]|nr:phosphopantetheine-binding protein [Actinocrinis sp.]
MQTDGNDGATAPHDILDQERPDGPGAGPAAGSTVDRIAGLFGRVLGVGGVGAQDDFFVLGGTSFSAMELLDAIVEEFGCRVPARAFYRATGVAELAGEVEDRTRAPQGSPAAASPGGE